MMTDAPSLDDVGSLPAEPAWDEAFSRVESYLRAYGLESVVLLHQVTGQIIHEAHGHSLAGSPGDPVSLAMALTHQRIGAWFARAGQQLDWSHESSRAQGRLALILADLPGRWSKAFLSPDPVPLELSSALSARQILPGPEMHFSNMPPAPLEFGFADAADPRLLARSIWLPFRTVVSWVLILGVFGVAWAASH